MQKRGDRLIVSPKDLIQYGESEFAAWMERWCVETGTQTPPPDEMTRVLERLGEEREQQFLWELEQSGQAVYRLQKRGSFKATIAAMQAGHPMIYQAALELQTATDHWQGYADFLVRVPLRSRLGDWSYVPMECKLALHAKPYFVIQACAYCELLAQVQGRMPEQFQLLLGTNEIQVHRTEDYLHYYRQVKTAFLQFLECFDPDKTPLPSMGNHGVWQEVADRALQQRDHLGLVANITRNQIKKLESAGVTTVAHLAQLAPDTRIPRLDPHITQRLRQQAQLQKARREGEPPPYCLLPLDPEKPRRGLALLPPASPLDVYFDMEGYPLSSEGRGGEMGVPARTQSGGKAKKQAKTPPHSRSHAQGLEYLFGASYEAASDKAASDQVDGQLQFQDWWAHNPTMERQAFEAFIDWVYDRWQRDPTLHVYHYAPYEPTALKRLMGRYGTREEELDTLLRHQVFVDLYQIVSQSLQIGEPAYSIKNLEHLYWRKRQGDVKTAQASVVQYYQWMQIRDGDTPETSAILAEIRDYNRDDCDSTHALTQWLRSLQIQHDRPYLPPDDRPEPESNEPASPKAQIRATLQQLATDLLTQTHSDFSVPTSDFPLSPLTQTLLAHLLQFHRREEKPLYWRLFQWLKMDETELYDELDCLAGLVRTATTPQKVKRSWHYEYHCDPQQETKLIPGQSYRVHRDGKPLNLTLADLNLAQGKATIAIGEPTLKKLREEEPNWDLPHRVSLLNHKPIPCDHLTQAIADTVRQWHEQRQIQPALADFLERRSPRFHNGKPLRSLCSEQPTLSEIITALAQLDNSYLCIQGPPGSGKTYTAANIILSLLQQGKTIAVSANSHKVIVNLLERVYLYQQRQDSSQDANRALAIAKIASDGETKVPGIAFPTDLKDALPPTYQLVGATVYKFCREIAIDQFDYLFVDEAGQVSLANLVAMARCAKNLVLIGDPLQLEQPLQGAHPGESGQSALGYLLNGRATIPADLGIFLGTSYRMHPTICRFISEAIYEGRLGHAQGTDCHYIQLEKMQPHSQRSGLWFLPVEHDDNTQSSPEEVAAIDQLVQRLLGLPYRSDRGTKDGCLTPAEILVVAPYNLQVRKLQERLGDRARCGTVDKFQGQEAPVAIVSMTTSRVEETARGLDFLLNRNRLNVAVSRAQCLAIVVASPALAKTSCSTLDQMVQVNLFCKLMAEAGTFVI